MSEKLTGSEYIAETLKANEVTHVFYEELAFYFTTKIMAPYGIKNVLAHSEEAAGYMADGYARTTGKPGVCMSQAIGSANLAASVHDAWLGNTPVIALTGFKPNCGLQKNGYQESDHRALFSGVTKYNQATYDAQQLPHLLRQCFRETTTGKPRPAHLDVIGYAGEVAEKAEMNDPFVPETAFSKYPAMRPSAEQETVLRAAKAIDSAKKPVIVAGRGAIISDRTGEALYTLASKGDIPVATTLDGKTIIDENDPLWAGVVGGYGMDCANKTTASADLVIYIGSMVSDQTTLNFTAPQCDKQIIQIDIDGSELGKNYPNTIGLLGDARTVMLQLTEVIAASDRPAWRKEVREYVDSTLAKQREISDSDACPIQTPRLLRELSNLLPDDAIVVSDTGYSAIWSCSMLRMKPSQKYTRAAGSLGWAFPASLGAKCGNPDRPVICFVGDGAFYYHLSELETAIRYGINTVTIINNNSRLNQCIPYAGEAYTNDEKEYDIYKKTVAFMPTDFVAIAEAFGAMGIKVTKAEDIAPAIKKGLAANKPVVIEVVTDCMSKGPLSPSNK